MPVMTLALVAALAAPPMSAGAVTATWRADTAAGACLRGTDVAIAVDDEAGTALTTMTVPCDAEAFWLDVPADIGPVVVRLRAEAGIAAVSLDAVGDPSDLGELQFSALTTWDFCDAHGCDSEPAPSSSPPVDCAASGGRSGVGVAALVLMAGLVATRRRRRAD